MKFDFCIGNPPYQETKGGTKNIDVWPSFVVGANEIADTVCYIHPGRWLVPKKQMKSVHDAIMKSGLKCFDYYPDSMKVFRSQDIGGGVTITLFKKKYDGNVKYCNQGNCFGYYNDNEMFFSNSFEEEAYQKTHLPEFGLKSMASYVIGNVGSLGGGEYGYSKVKHISLLRSNSDNMVYPIKIWANAGFGSASRYAWHFIEKDKIDKIPEILLSTRKVMISKKGHSIERGSGTIFDSIPQIVDKNAIASGDVFFIIPAKDTDYDLQLIKSLFMTKTARFLMSITQKDLYVRGFENIPDYQCLKLMLKKELFSDEFFYDNFRFSKDLINHIEKHVSGKAELVACIAQKGKIVGQIKK